MLDRIGAGTTVYFAAAGVCFAFAALFADYLIPLIIAGAVFVGIGVSLSSRPKSEAR